VEVRFLSTAPFVLKHEPEADEIMAGLQTSQRDPVIALIPYYLKVRGKLVDISLDDLEWPIGRPQALEGMRVGDLGPQDHLFTYPRRWIYGRAARGLAANLSLMIVEPRSYHGHHMKLARLFHKRFYRVLTCDAHLLANIPNGEYFVFGNTWVEDWRDKDCTKTKMLSLIASNRKSLKGHKLRHRIVRHLRQDGTDVDIMGRGGYKFFEDKADGLATYRYSVIIENTREPGYFTEKLIDAFLLETVPIYWGAPDIGDFFNMEGIVECSDEATLLAAIQNISEDDYRARLPALFENRKTAIKYSNVLKSAAKVILAAKR
jgi:glycosyl transferase family 10 (putative fucosyltransferase)